MSVSSVGSMASVSHHGEQVSLDRALELCVNDLIRHLNHVQLALRSIAAAPEQDLPFNEELDLARKMDDDLRQMGYLLEDLRYMEEDLLSIPETPEDKLLLKTWKTERKVIEKKAYEEHAAQVKEDRLAAKEALKAEKAAMKESESKMAD